MMWRKAAILVLLFTRATGSSCAQEAGDSLDSVIKKVKTAASHEQADLSQYAWQVRKNGHSNTSGLWSVLEIEKSYTKWSEKVFTRVGAVKNEEWIDGGGGTEFVESPARFALCVLLDLLGSQYFFPDLERMTDHEVRHWQRSFQEWYKARCGFLEWHPDTWTWRLNWNRLIASHFNIAHAEAGLLRQALLDRLKLKVIKPGEPIATFMDKHLIPALCAGSVQSSRDLLDDAPWHYVTTPDALAEAMIEAVPIELKSRVVRGLVVHEMSTVRLCLRRLESEEVYSALMR